MVILQKIKPDNQALNIYCENLRNYTFSHRFDNFTDLLLTFYPDFFIDLIKMGG